MKIQLCCPRCALFCIFVSLNKKKRWHRQAHLNFRDVILWHFILFRCWKSGRPWVQKNEHLNRLCLRGVLFTKDPKPSALYNDVLGRRVHSFYLLRSFVCGKKRNTALLSGETYDEFLKHTQPFFFVWLVGVSEVAPKKRYFRSSLTQCLHHILLRPLFWKLKMWSDVCFETFVLRLRVSFSSLKLQWQQSTTMQTFWMSQNPALAVPNSTTTSPCTTLLSSARCLL